MKLAFIALCLFLAVSVNASLRKPYKPAATQAQAKKDFDFYVFASEWAGSVCTTNSCTSAYDEGVVHDFWNIHGLWPSDGKMGVNYCSDEKFNPSLLSSIKSDLAGYWSGLYSSADSFHGHEWEKHGTCSGMSQIDYFTTTIKLARELDVFGALQRHNIIPGTQTYSCDQVAKAIQQTYGITKFSLSNPSKYLTELQLCVNKDFQVQDCPKAKICNGEIKYPALNL